jgi:hypothetical protein
MGAQVLLKALSIGSVVSVLLLAACTTTPLDPEVDWDSGARRARIVEFYSPDTPSARLPTCLANLSKTEFAARRFVKVKYRAGRLTSFRVAEVPETMQAKVRDEVEVWPENCSDGKISRISRILRSPSQ